MQRDGLIRLETLGEVVALDHARDRVFCGDFDEAGGAHAAEPA